MAELIFLSTPKFNQIFPYAGSNPHYKISTGDGQTKETEESCVKHEYKLLDLFKTGQSEQKIMITDYAFNNVSSQTAMVFVVLFKPVVLLKVRLCKFFFLGTGQN